MKILLKITDMTQIIYVVALAIVTALNYFLNRRTERNYTRVIELYKNAHKQQCDYIDSLVEYIMTKIINDAIEIEDFELAERARKHYELVKNRNNKNK